MAWGKGVRKEVFERQNGLCSFCQKPLNGQFILHHIKNRKDRGPSISSNATARHSWCESYCHANYRNGNPCEPQYIEVPKKRKRLRSDKRHLHRLICDEQYAWKSYCGGVL